MLLLPIAAVALYAQNAQITGRVTDPTGAVVPGADVTVTNVDTGDKRTAASNEQGYYTVLFLIPGNYQVQMQKQGFRAAARTGLRLQVDQVARLDFTLELGGVAESVDVVGTAPLVESETSSIGQVVNNKSIVEMPLNGRNAWHLVQLTAATVFVGGIGDAGEIPVASMAGGRAFSQMLWVDGGSVQKSSIDRAMAELAPMVDAVEEFKVITNNYAAEYGRSAGGVFSAVTKSGTNQFRGTAFEFLRNNALDARNFFASRQAPLRYNQFGGTLGGPIRKDKTHFFAALEGTKQSRGETGIFTLPTPDHKRGVFTGLVDVQRRPLQLYNPFTTRVNPSDPSRRLRDPFPNNVIPTSLFDPVAARALTFYPDPNTAGNAAGANNFNINIFGRRTQYHGTARVDHTLTDKDRLFFRYINQYNFTPQSNAFPEPAASGLGPTPTRNISNMAQTFMGSYIRTISPTLISDLKFAWVRQGRSIFHESVGGNWPEKLGLRGVEPISFPVFRPQGYALLGSPNTFREQRGSPYQFMENITWSRGNHNWKAGFEYRYNSSADEFDRSPSGDFTFAQQGTGLQGNTLTGNGFASMLLGFATNAVVREAPVLNTRAHYFGGFLQDDWKVTPRFTLNLGVRYDVEPSPFSPDNSFNAFDGNAVHPTARVPGVVTFAGVGGTPTSLFDTDYNNLAPRFGFAWRPFGDDRTVVRGGYGVFIGNTNDIGYGSDARLGFSLDLLLVSPDQNQTPAFLLKDGFPAYAKPGPESRTPAFGLNTSITYYERQRATPYSQQFNFGVQREVRGILLEGQYLGNLGRKLTATSASVNQVPESRLGGAGSIQSRRPFPQFTDVVLSSPNWGASSYHAFVLRAEKRYQNGLQFLFNYTFSKFLDNVDHIAGGDFGGTPGAGYQDFYNRSLDKALSPNDVRHLTHFNAIWDLPAGPGRRFLKSGPLGQILGGWQLSVLGTAHTGAPYGVTTQQNTCECFSSGPQRADILRDPGLESGERSTARWFDTAAFAQPGRFRFGNSARSIGRSPGRVNFDLGIMKNFKLNERARLQFRGEMFNAFNHANFGNPGTAFGSPNFGSINNALDARIMQLGLKLYF
ncbi:MAG: TonB-dependent receptor [Bryobacteraceae bacterium]|nr:TonB-dependent receptor [Bryobacteraceae bacterium]